MSIPRERLQQQTQQTARATLAGARQAGADAEVQADALQDRALEAQAEQAALLEASPLESQYSAAFAAQVEAKHDQAERVEDRLEDLIERQESRMQQAQAKQPGMLALPSTRAKAQAKPLPRLLASLAASLNSWGPLAVATRVARLGVA